MPHANNPSPGAEVWDNTPLGPDVQPPPFRPAPAKRQLRPTLKRLPAEGRPVRFVEEGRPVCAIVLPDEPNRSAEDAAAELQRGLRLMSGAEVPVVREGELDAAWRGDALVATLGAKEVPYLVLVGEGRLSRECGVSQEAMPPEGYAIFTRGNALVVAGRDLPDGGRQTFGTRHGVCALMERHFGFRWLWPGELGEVVPKASTVEVGPLREEDAPALPLRRIRNRGVRDRAVVKPTFCGDDHPYEKSGYFTPHDPDPDSLGFVCLRMRQGLERLGFTTEERLAWQGQSYPWYARNRLGQSAELRQGHSYEEYWNRFGREHPEWFALQPQPGRGREQQPPRERLCVSNRELAAQVARDKLAEFEAEPYIEAAAIGPNDGSAENTYCMCEECRKLDPPAGAPVQLLFDLDGERKTAPYVSLTDRFVVFYSRVAEKVAEKRPDKFVTGYAYSRYRSKPLYAKVHPNLMICFVGFTYFDDAALEEHRRDWEAWAAAAPRILLRPNLLLEGHGFPALYASKMAQDVKRCYETGMDGADFCSVNHHWANQGLNAYVLAKLMWDPSLDPVEIVADYCEKGFGAAAEHVLAYYRDVEGITDNMAAEKACQKDAAGTMDAVEMDWLAVHGGYEARFFGPETLARLRGHLDKAKEAAQGDEAALRRVAFLALGLQWAEIQARLRDPALEKDPERGRALMAERYALARRIFKEQPYCVGVTWLFWREGDFCNRFGFEADAPG